ncbi:MAG: RNA pyrophosphohydrolase [Francisellaceae bacterium]
MIDQEGFRANVAIVLLNDQNQVFWGKRVHQTSWQFPQGGLNPGETPIEAMYRELKEEVGLNPCDVEVIAATRTWLRYRLPRSLIRRNNPLCIGQKQKWFLLRLKSADETIDLRVNKKPEFDAWRWVNYWYPTEKVVPFKRHVYRKALEYFFPIMRNWQKGDK